MMFCGCCPLFDVCRVFAVLLFVVCSVGVSLCAVSSLFICRFVVVVALLCCCCVILLCCRVVVMLVRCGAMCVCLSVLCCVVCNV